jgi:(2R)-3-sulfolactate dehydrogenase (NADP+)
MAKFSIQDVQARATAVLLANRTDATNAESVARALVQAEADGLGGHGLMRLASYAAQARCGKVDGFARATLAETTDGTAIIDAQHGFAYPAIDLAIEFLLAAAPARGIAAISITRSGHCGAMGLAVERLANAGLVALMLANTPAAMAPWGGRRALFGTNPIACAFPRPAAAPVVIDLSLSKVARGHIVAAKQRGEAIPEDWALDADGKPTADPGAALAGTMVPAGEAKGAALALMVEAMAAGLTGSRFAFQASSFLDTDGPPPSTGQMMIALNPTAFGPGIAHLEELFTAVAGESGARLPGERRLANRRDAANDGIEIKEAWFSV